jgi:hypothetical protein
MVKSGFTSAPVWFPLRTLLQSDLSSCTTGDVRRSVGISKKDPVEASLLCLRVAVGGGCGVKGGGGILRLVLVTSCRWLPLVLLSMGDTNMGVGARELA